MKQKIFTLMILLALVVAGGKAFSANETDVYIGCTYNYTLANVASNVAATAVVSWEAANAAVVITPDANGYSITGGAAARVLGFSVKYGTPTDDISSGLLRVIITNNAAPTCSNYITLTVTVHPAPTYSLAISTDLTDYSSCQTRTTPSVSNQANATEATTDESNTFDFVVTPTISGIPAGTEYTYSYTITVPTGTGLNTYTVTAGGVISHTLTEGGTPPAADTYTVKFNTTTNLAQVPLTATITAASLTIDGGGTSCETITADVTGLTETVNVDPVPSIGTFR